VVFDAADIETESAFWASLLEADVDKADDWHSIRTPDGRRLAVQLAPDHTPPEWPDGSPQQMHVDLWVEDVESAEQEVLAPAAPGYSKPSTRTSSACTPTPQGTRSASAGTDRHCSASSLAFASASRATSSSGNFGYSRGRSLMVVVMMSETAARIAHL
jgi:hypothetical protein